MVTYQTFFKLFSNDKGGRYHWLPGSLWQVGNRQCDLRKIIQKHFHLIHKHLIFCIRNIDFPHHYTLCGVCDSLSRTIDQQANFYPLPFSRRHGLTIYGWMWVWRGCNMRQVQAHTFPNYLGMKCQQRAVTHHWYFLWIFNLPPHEWQIMASAHNFTCHIWQELELEEGKTESPIYKSPKSTLQATKGNLKAKQKN